MTARDRFTATYRAVIELNNIKALIASDGDDWKPAQEGNRAGRLHRRDSTAHRGRESGFGS